MRLNTMKAGSAPAFERNILNYFVTCMTPFMSSQWPGNVHM